MYEEFFGLREAPFNLTPDLRFVFRTESLLEAVANLQYGIESGKGLVVLTGEAGSGKTLTLRWILGAAEQSAVAAYVFNPLLSTSEFYELLTTDFGLGSTESKTATLKSLESSLRSRHAQGSRTLLVVDEAHLLPTHLLEEVRLLTNLETDRDALLQVILCGQPELNDVLGAPETWQLKQRISLNCVIQPLSEAETADYIDWRLQVAGAARDRIFEANSMRAMYKFSRGIPRLINNLADNAMLAVFSDDVPRVTAATIEHVAQELHLAPAVPASPTVGCQLDSLKSLTPRSGFPNDPSIGSTDWNPNQSMATRSAVATAVPTVHSRRSDSPVENAKFALSSFEGANHQKTKFFSRVKAERRP